MKKGFKIPKQKMWGYLFISPFIIYFAVFLLYPIFLAIQNSFLDINLLEPEKAKFVGFENWINAIIDPLFWKSMFNILYNQIIYIFLTFVVSLFLALVLNEVKFLGSLFRTIYFIPVITSITVSMVLFQFLMSPTGPLQSILLNSGVLSEPIYWTFTKWLPMPVIAFFSVWKWFGISMVIYLGGLASIDPKLYEAADIDGAKWHDKVFKISIPLLKPQIIFMMTMNIINGLQMFTESYMNFDLLGGRYNSALTPVLYLYGKGFDQMKMGEASSIGLLLAGIIFILTMLQLKFFNRNEEEDF